MTHQNHQTNGASLEDCHTNFFALTELYGIKWRKLVWGETSGGGDGEDGGAPLADPVISSYARCLAGDILCVWRRVPAPPPPDNIYEMSAPVPPPLSLRAAKELWIFWYGEEPDLNGLVAPELIASQGDQGSWESGLSYECRSLLFKALHNLIERCLLSRDFVRLGKWFVQPYDGDEEEVGKSPWHLSFSFAFFLHGESTVCASVDVRQHPPVRTLTAKRLAKINSPDNQADAKVILAPFGLEGTLTGREWSDADAGTARLLDAWRQLYPLEQGCGAVEVICGGARMRYPLPYALVTHMEPGAPPAHAPHMAHRALAALTTPAPHQAAEICYGEAAGDKSDDFIDPTRKTPCTCAKLRRRRGPRAPPFHRRTRPKQPLPAHKPPAPALGAGMAGGAACSPGSCGGASPAAGGSAPPSAGAQPPSPHHQALPNHQVSAPPPRGSCGGASPAAGGSAPPSAGAQPPSPHHQALPNHQVSAPPPRGSCGGASPAAGGSAPPSAGAQPPSPHHQALPNHQVSAPPPRGSCGGASPAAGGSAPPSAGAQPPSPHHQALPNHQVSAPPPRGSCGGASPAAGGSAPPSAGAQPPSPHHQALPNHQVSAPPPRGSCGGASPAAGGSAPPSAGAQPPSPHHQALPNHQVSAPPPRGSCGGASPAAGGSAPPSAGAQPPSPHHQALPNHQVSAPPPRGSCGGASPAAGGSAPPSAGAQPPSPHHQALPNHQSAGIVPTTLHTPAPTPDPHAPPTPAPPSLPPPKTYTQGSPPRCSLGARPALAGAAPRADPLEDEHELHMLYDYTTVYAWLEHPVKRFKSSQNSFREEMALGAGAGGDLYAGHDHTKMAAMRDHALLDIKQEKHDHNEDAKEYKNLFTSDGLCPALKDLEQMFDTSDDATSGDETVRLLQVSTPPDSNKSVEEARCGTRGCPRAEELSKMFPTPPSMEAHAQASPGFSLPDDAPRLLAPAGSPPPDHAIEDWSYVFKPPTVFKYVGSSKYAPLTTLPSQLMPPVSLPAHAVYRPRCHHELEPTKQREEPEPDTNRTAGIKRSAPPTPESREGRTRRPGEPLSVPGAGGSTPRDATPGPAPARAPRRADPAGPAPALHAACPLMLNVLLADTVLNVFRDHNFDSCTLCVCNAGPKVVGNIRGADAATYLTGCSGMGGAGAGGASPELAPDDEPSHCTCGFSAILNRRRAHRAGLFYEDEMEITGLAEEPGLRSVRGAGLGEVARVVLAQSAAPPGGPASALARAAHHAADHPPADERGLNLLEYTDGGTAAARALRAAARGVAGAGPRGAGPRGAGPRGAPGAGPPAVHRWPFIGARAPRCSRDVVRLMRRLRPLLQDAIQKRCCGARMWDGVTGPLTWRQFHRLAGRGNEDLCEPQPVPPLLVGHDRDWISLSPYALRHWERLALEPYSYARDVAYVVVAADNDALTEPLRAFFRELSTAYESCRLGRHQPIGRIAREGLVRCSPTGERRDERDDWTGTLPPGRLGEHLRAYSDTLRSTLLPQLAALTVDRALLDADRPAQEAMRPPSTPDHPATPTSAAEPDDSSTGGCSSSSGPGVPGSSSTAGSWDEEEGGAPVLVVYVVEPPASHAHRPLALHALLKLAARTMDHLHHHNPLVKIISLESICSRWGLGTSSTDTVGAGGAGAGGAADVRALAFSVFSGARRLLQHHPNGKSLTGFGTAADSNLFLQNKDEKNREPYKLFSPAWVLAAPRALKEVAETWGQGSGEQGGVLFLAYCLSHDQRWLLASATDARGELLDTAAINIHVPHRSRRRRSGPARRLGLTKLMDFTLGVMSQAAQPWRLVVGRVGRIGHGELKGWSWLLSRKHLVRASAMLRDICASCGVLYPGGVPCILSACLVSTEPDSCLRLMADRFTPDERFSQASIQSHLHTPRDVTATHILVFPTSATTQSNQMPFEPPMANGDESDMMFLNVDMGDEDMGEDNMTDLFIGDMFNNMWAAGSPRRTDDDPAASPQAHHHHQAAFHHQDDNASEAVGALLQQPLALGYMVSTAPLGSMPAWWWAGCAHLRDACPAFLKSALHLHAGSLQAADDYTSLTQRRDHNTHPLDSQTTTDVLRYVLEGYNALSWLALDGNTHDRLSCLPLHVQVLMQLYHTAAALG